jgi:nucleoside phosphorylase
MPSLPPSRVLIVTALPIEREAVLRYLSNTLEERHSTGTQYEVGSFLSWKVCVSQIAPGNSSAALETERAIAYFDPDIALFVGIAGGIKDVKLGDVVAATKVYGYENGADREHFQPRPDVGLSSYPLVQEAKIVAREESWLARTHRSTANVTPRAFVGPIAAGAKVIKSSRGTVATLLRESYGDTLAVEMEGEGFMRAAYTNKVDGMVVRGVSDLLDGKVEADSSGSQEVASDHAAAFAFELLARLARQTIAELATRARHVRDKENAPAEVIDPVDFWTRLRELVPRLYPRGPVEGNVWEESGGDLSYLDLSGNARTQWSRAIRQLEKGGGGNVSAATLLDRMLQEFGKNYELQYLHALLNEQQ